MASSQEPTQDLPSSVVQYNHIVIQYQQPNPAVVNHIIKVLIGVTRTFTHRNPAQVPYIWGYITQIVPVLQTLYSQSTSQVLIQGGVPPPVSNATYLLPAHGDLQKLFSELSVAQSSSLGMMAHLQF